MFACVSRGPLRTAPCARHVVEVHYNGAARHDARAPREKITTHDGLQDAALAGGLRANRDDRGEAHRRVAQRGQRLVQALHYHDEGVHSSARAQIKGRGGDNDERGGRGDAMKTITGPPTSEKVESTAQKLCANRHAVRARARPVRLRVAQPRNRRNVPSHCDSHHSPISASFSNVSIIRGSFVWDGIRR